MIKGLVFDFDGVIVDTESPALHAWQKLYEEFGQVLDSDRWADYFLRDAFDPLEYLAGLCSAEFDRMSANDRRNAIKSELCDSATLCPGVQNWLVDATRLNMKLAVASSSRRPWVTHHLSRHRILDCFHSITTREDITSPKPSPEIYLTTAKRLGVLPEELLAIEDSPNGLSAATRAGIKCIVVPNDVTHQMEFPERHIRLVTLSEISLPQLLLSRLA